MKKHIYMIIVLAVVGLIAGSSLALVYKYASPLIDANQKKKLETAIFKVVPGAASYKEAKKGEGDIFEVYDKSGKLLGYVFKAKGNGYQGEIEILGGIDKGLSSLLGIEILESNETPGLGGEIASDKFKDQFKDLKLLPGIECVKGEKKKENEIQAITGATISSKSVTNILNDEISALKKTIKKR